MRFDSYHPMINLIYFTAAILCTVCFDHPVFLAISFLCAFLYSIKLNGWKSLILGFCLVILWFSCIFRLITADKVVYLFGRISPKLSLFLSILLRTVPRIGVRAKRIEKSREGIGWGICQGNLFQRFFNLCALISILITWTLEDFVESAISMKSWGYSLKGRTAFSIYRFDNRDRSLVIAFFWCLTALLMAVLFNQTMIYYDPVIVGNRITGMSYVFYGVYAVFLLLPMGLQIVGELRFAKEIAAKN